MPVEHIPTGKVHKGIKGGTTACGKNTNEHPSHWRNTTSKITCDKDMNVGVNSK